MNSVDGGFRERVYALVGQIPQGGVMTYGQLAALAGSPSAARVVGGIAHFGDPSLPWQRVVNKQGGLANGYPGGRAAHKAQLEAEGIHVSDDYYVNVDELLWNPEVKNSNIKYQISNIPAKLVVIVGPTASGKSALALELAQILDGEIICADSRTVYKGMDIGTAKPSKAEKQQVPHHLLDVVEPDQNFTVSDFKRLADEAIKDIQSRGKLPIMVGGSGLYVDAVLFDYGFSDANAAKDEQNPRHLSKDVPRLKQGMRPNALVIGLSVDRDVLKQRISIRVDAMVEVGFVDEVKRLQAAYGHTKAMLTPGYKAFGEHLLGHLSVEEAKALFIKNDLNLAKRQMTWFRRNKSIHWLSHPSTYVEDTLNLLSKLQ